MKKKRRRNIQLKFHSQIVINAQNVHPVAAGDDVIGHMNP